MRRKRPAPHLQHPACTSHSLRWRCLSASRIASAVVYHGISFSFGSSLTTHCSGCRFASPLNLVVTTRKTSLRWPCGQLAFLFLRVWRERVWPAVADVCIYRFVNASHHLVSDNCASHYICAAAFCVNKPQPRLSRPVVPIGFHGLVLSLGM